MATQSYIIDAETRIVNTGWTVEQVGNAIIVEQQKNDGKVYPENRDCWGTLRLNLLTLRRRIDATLLFMGEFEELPQ